MRVILGLLKAPLPGRFGSRPLLYLGIGGQQSRQLGDVARNAPSPDPLGPSGGTYYLACVMKEDHRCLRCGLPSSRSTLTARAAIAGKSSWRANGVNSPKTMSLPWGEWGLVSDGGEGSDTHLYGGKHRAIGLLSLLRPKTN